jgi:hypothetical protein
MSVDPPAIDDSQRRQVEAMAGVGIPVGDIAIGRRLRRIAAWDVSLTD